MAELNTRPWHKNMALGPYLFYDVHGSEKNQVRRSGDQGTSKSNEVEAKACLALVCYLCSQARDINVKHAYSLYRINLCVNVVCWKDWYCDTVQGSKEDSSEGI